MNVGVGPGRHADFIVRVSHIHGVLDSGARGAAGGAVVAAVVAGGGRSHVAGSALSQGHLRRAGGAYRQQQSDEQGQAEC